MSLHKANVTWKRETPGFSYTDYNREHLWKFPGGNKVDASAAPEFLGKTKFVDPEEAFVASVSACHMLTFLAICSRRRLVVDSYNDEACGYMEKNEQGRLAITRVELSPRIRFGGEAPDAKLLAKLHHMSHEQCFIANSINTEVIVLNSH